MKRIWILLAVLGITACGTSIALDSGNNPPNTNSVEYWCPNGGIKYEPVSTPFTVPAPPDDKVWTLLVLKAGSEQGGSVEEENEQFPNPVVGQQYSRTDGKDISHAILCYDNTSTTTTHKPYGTTTTNMQTTTTQQGTTTTGGTLTPFALQVIPGCVDGEPVIIITFGTRTDLNGQTGTLAFSTGGSVPLVYQANATVNVPWPDGAGDIAVLTYTIGSETEDAGPLFFPEGCESTTTVATTAPPTTVAGTTTTSQPGVTTTTVRPATTTTTTQPPIPPITGPAEVFSFSGAATVCVREVPTIRITFGNTFPALAGQTGTLTMRTVNGNGVVGVQSLVYAPGTTVDILYPGTRVNPDGSIADVPGWNLNSSGYWVPDPNDAFLRDGIVLTYVLNPTATATVTYPPESSTCANPDGPFPPNTPPPTPGLPPTR